MKKIFTKLLSVFICALMIAYLLPTSVYASAINRISKPTVQEQGQSVDGDAEPYAIGEDISLRNENTKYIATLQGLKITIRIRHSLLAEQASDI